MTSTRRRTRKPAVRDSCDPCGAASWRTPTAANLAQVKAEHVRPKKARRSDCDRRLWLPVGVEAAPALRCKAMRPQRAAVRTDLQGLRAGVVGGA